MVAPDMLVVALCAAWCHTCEEFRPAYERIAREFPGAAFVWLDIEDDSDRVDDVEVEDFPTLAVFRGGVPVHFGPSLPHEGVVRRLLQALASETHAAAAVSDAVRTLPGRLKAPAH